MLSPKLNPFTLLESIFGANKCFYLIHSSQSGVSHNLICLTPKKIIASSMFVASYAFTFEVKTNVFF